MKYAKIYFNGNLTEIRDQELKQSIPIDECNVEYRDYLNWLAADEANIPDEINY